MIGKDLAISAVLAALGAADLLVLDARAVPAWLQPGDAAPSAPPAASSAPPAASSLPPAASSLPPAAIASAELDRAEPAESARASAPPGELPSRAARAAAPESLVVHFETGSHRLSTADVARIEALADASPAGRYSVGGHSDVRGDEAFNDELSAARAKAAADVLRRRGVPASQVQIRGFGSSRLLDRGVSAAAHERNRRAEITVARGGL